jgi:hypothetical protein
VPEHLLYRAGDAAGPRELSGAAADLAASLPMQRYLNGRAARLG